jgi:hypothetical protein
LDLFLISDFEFQIYFILRRINMSVTIDEAYSSTYCLEQFLQDNQDVNCGEVATSSNNDIESQEIQNEYYEETRGNNIDIEA